MIRVSVESVLELALGRVRVERFGCAGHPLQGYTSCLQTILWIDLLDELLYGKLSGEKAQRLLSAICREVFRMFGERKARKAGRTGRGQSESITPLCPLDSSDHNPSKAFAAALYCMLHSTTTDINKYPIEDPSRLSTRTIHSLRATEVQRIVSLSSSRADSGCFEMSL